MKKEVVNVKAPRFGEILTARPVGMSYEDYRNKLVMQNAKLKARKRGFLCYKSSEVIETEAGGRRFSRVKKYPPCVGKCFVVKFV